MCHVAHSLYRLVIDIYISQSEVMAETRHLAFITMMFTQRCESMAVNMAWV